MPSAIDVQLQFLGLWHLSEPAIQKSLKSGANSIVNSESICGEKDEVENRIHSIGDMIINIHIVKDLKISWSMLKNRLIIIPHTANISQNIEKSQMINSRSHHEKSPRFTSCNRIPLHPMWCHLCLRKKITASQLLLGWVVAMMFNIFHVGGVRFFANQIRYQSVKKLLVFL